MAPVLSFHHTVARFVRPSDLASPFLRPKPPATLTFRFPLKLHASPNLLLSTSRAPSFQVVRDCTVLTGSTRTVTTLFALALAISKVLAEKLFPALSRAAVSISVRSTGPLFFAAMRDTVPGKLSSPLAVVAAGMTKWLDIFSSVLLIRVLLSWFPNIPWDRQPLSAMRDLCDPYLSLFRNIIPPVFDTLDVSPILAFTVLGVLNMILDSNVN